MPRHPHAEKMIEYGIRARTEMEPWRDMDHAVAPSVRMWFPCMGPPLWKETHEYRWRAKTIRIGDMDVPAPETEAPEVGTAYYVPALLEGNPAARHYWSGDTWDHLRLARAIIHLPKENAIIHAKAFIAVSGGKVDDEEKCS